MKCGNGRSWWCAKEPARQSPVDGYVRPRLIPRDHPIRDTRDVIMRNPHVPWNDLYMMAEATRPMMVLAVFPTKRECQRYIKERYGYIAKRSDLRRGPHKLRMPKPVRVTVAVTEQRNG